MSSGADPKPNWLQQYLDAAVRKKLCTQIHCTTCGAQEFRRGLLRALELHTGLSTGDRFTSEAALALARDLAGVERSPVDPLRGDGAVRCVLYDLWSALNPKSFDEELVPLLAGTWAGDVLARMQEHSRRLEQNKRKQAEFESPAAVTERRAEKQRVEQQKLTERLARKAERDRLWRQQQQNPGA